MSWISQGAGERDITVIAWVIVVVAVVCVAAGFAFGKLFG